MREIIYFRALLREILIFLSVRECVKTKKKLRYSVIGYLKHIFCELVTVTLRKSSCIYFLHLLQFQLAVWEVVDETSVRFFDFLHREFGFGCEIGYEVFVKLKCIFFPDSFKSIQRSERQLHDQITTNN